GRGAVSAAAAAAAETCAVDDGEPADHRGGASTGHTAPPPPGPPAPPRSPSPSSTASGPMAAGAAHAGSAGAPVWSPPGSTVRPAGSLPASRRSMPSRLAGGGQAGPAV